MRELRTPFLLRRSAPGGTIPEPNPDPDPVEPGAPRNVRLSNIGQDRMDVLWDAPISDGGDPVSGYEVVYRIGASGSLTTVASVGSPQELTDLEPGTIYQVSVRARNSVGWGEWSEWVEHATDDADPEPEPNRGPIRPKTAIAGNIVMCGNSTFASTEVPLRAIWGDGGTVYHEHGDWPYNFWSNDGPARNQPYNYLFMIENDLLDANGSDAGAETAIGYPDPASSRGISGLELGYWIAQEVADRDAELFLTVVGPNHAVDYDERNRAIMAFWVEWMREHVPGLKVWLYDMPLIVEHLRAGGIPDDQIWAPAGGGTVDPLHYAERGAKAFAWGIHYLISGTLPDGAAGEDSIVAQAVIDAVESAYWSGFGGTVGHEPFIDFDPLPNPAARPGHPDPDPEPVVPSVPRNVRFSGIEADGFQVLWDEPAEDGGAAVTAYELEYRISPNGSASTIPGASSPQEVTGLEAETPYDVCVRARNSVGWGPASEWVTQETAAEGPGPDPDPEPMGDIEWTADSYSGPTRIGTLPTVSNGIMTFNNRVAFEIENSGFYFIAAVRSAFNNTACLVFANPDPTNIGVDPFTSATTWGASVAMDRYPEGVGQGIGDLPQNTWVVVEFWSIGNDIGGRIGAGSDTTAGDTPGPFGPTDYISVFDDLGNSIPFEVAALAIRLELPSEQERADLRAWAQSLIPA